MMFNCLEKYKVGRTAILFQAHTWTPFVRLNLNKILAEVKSDKYDIWLLSEHFQDLQGLDCPENCRQFNFSYRKLFLQVYGRVPDTKHRYRWDAPFYKYYGQLLPILAFCELHPEYPHVWRMEYDAYFHGYVETFFDFWRNDHSDLLCPHISTNLDGWVHGDLFVGPEKFQHELKTKCLTVVMRLSHRAARLIMKELAKYLGHHELMLPTLVRALGCTLSDFGADGPFTSRKSQNKFYVGGSENSTVRVTKPWTLKTILKQTKGNQNIWYHPVKSID